MSKQQSEVVVVMRLGPVTLCLVYVRFTKILNIIIGWVGGWGRWMVQETKFMPESPRDVTENIPAPHPHEPV